MNFILSLLALIAGSYIYSLMASNWMLLVRWKLVPYSFKRKYLILFHIFNSISISIIAVILAILNVSIWSVAGIILIIVSTSYTSFFLQTYAKQKGESFEESLQEEVARRRERGY